MAELKLEEIVALCKRRGFIFPASEIYGGFANTYDYGHYGVLFKNNVKAEWWRAMLQERDDIVGLDSAIIQHPRVWEASGHLEGFSDPLVQCLGECKKRWRLDHLQEEQLGSTASSDGGAGEAEPVAADVDIRCPECGGELSEPRQFNLMFETYAGPVQDDASKVYLRPETAQGIFINFKNVLQFSRKKPPFGIAQVGKSFRNEITPGNFIFRTREFEQMEMEFFVPPAEAAEWHDRWMEERMRWYTDLGIRPDQLRLRAHGPDELSHYSSATSDIEYLFPMGWSELEGIANRGDFDLTQHAKFSGEKLEYVDSATGDRYVPHVIEPAAGVDRAMLCLHGRRVRHGGGRGPPEDPAPPPSEACSGQGRGAPAGQQGRPAREGPGDLRGASRADVRRVRHGRLDREALPPPGRDRDALGGDGGPPDHGGRHRHPARP